MIVHRFKPLGKNVLVFELQWPDKSSGGIWYPEMVKYSNSTGGKLPWRGRVLRIGKDVAQVKPGDMIRYQPGNYFQSTIEEAGKRYFWIDELLIYAVEDENENLIRALKNKIVFLPDQLEEKYGKIYLPQNREEPLLYGKIIVAGPGTDVSAGDKIVIKNLSTWQYFDAAGKRYILTDRDNILGVVLD